MGDEQLARWEGSQNTPKFILLSSIGTTGLPSDSQRPSGRYGNIAYNVLIQLLSTSIYQCVTSNCLTDLVMSFPMMIAKWRRRTTAANDSSTIEALARCRYLLKALKIRTSC